MLFYNEEEICEKVVPLGFHHAVLEDDGTGRMICIAVTGIPNDARELVDYLQAMGRTVVYVDLSTRSK